MTEEQFDKATLERLVRAVAKLMHRADQDLRALAQQILARVRDLAPALVPVVEAPRPDDRWWAPEDIAAPPTTERVTPAPPLFTREDVDSVLRDL